jgi:hypothetical protein
MLKAKCNLATLLIVALLGACSIPCQARSQTSELTKAEQAIHKGNYEEALKYLQPKAGSGDPAAQCLLASLYDKGLGVQANTVEADKWYKAAAFCKRAEVIDQVTPNWPRNQKDLDLLLKRVKKNEPLAKNELGFLYQHGIAVEKDMAKAGLNKQVRPDLYFGFMREKLTLPKTSFSQTKHNHRFHQAATIGANVTVENTVR